MSGTPSPPLPGLSCEESNLYQDVNYMRYMWHRDHGTKPKYLYVDGKTYNCIRCSANLKDGYGVYIDTAGTLHFLGLEVLRVDRAHHLGLGM